MRYILSIILILFLSQVVISQDTKGYQLVPDIKTIEQNLMEQSGKINTIYSDFVQEKHLAYLNDVIISDGKFWFQKENNLRWEYTTPFEYVIVINNGKFKIKDGEEVKEYDVNSNKAFQEVNKMIINSVKGDLLKDDRFTVEALQNKDSYLIKLEPKDEIMAKVLSKIELYFNKSDLNIFKVKMIEEEDNFTVISFKNKKINETIPTNIFILK